MVHPLGAGRDCRDVFLGRPKTCAKQGVSFWDCLGDRLKVPDAPAVAYLPDLVKQQAAPLTAIRWLRTSELKIGRDAIAGNHGQIRLNAFARARVGTAILRGGHGHWRLGHRHIVDGVSAVASGRVW